MTQGETLYMEGKLDDAWELLLAEEEAGYSRAGYLVGQYYLLGLSHVNKNERKAGAYFLMGRDGDALCRLESHFFTAPAGDEIALGKEALLAAEKQAENDPVAAVCLSYMYRVGIPKITERDTAKGVAYLTAAAGAHFWQGLNDLGLLYLNGQDVPKDEEKGAALLSEACGLSISLSEYHMAFCFLSGTGVPKDIAKGVEYYEKAWRHGYALAAVELGMRYETGNEVPVNEKKAVQLYKKAAERGFLEAKAHLGDCYLDGKGVRADKKLALRLYREAANGGDVYGTVRMGQVLFEKGEQEKAFPYFLRAAESGLPAAEYLVGVALWRGLGVAPDAARAKEFLRRAAAGGSGEAAEALRMIGGSYESGR